MRETALALMPQAAAISAAVQWVLSPGGGLEVNATTRSATSGPSGAMREGRVLSRSRPTTPSCMNRSCQRQTQVLDLRVRRMISLVPRPSAESSTISARQTCFCGALRSFKITFSRLRSEGFNVMDIPVRMRQTRTSGAAWESQMGFKCQTGTTSWLQDRSQPAVLRPAQPIPAHRFRGLGHRAG
jgi:hypothetical protein